ncbi:MAG: GGDEF domain-containing protein [Deltaproteobacteria bacterium]|jgi:diguanylate cyclase (GGDEF)-like protein|nr:GGDEF domain-containing protein [Deltaproteobacteria bacterium]
MEVLETPQSGDDYRRKYLDSERLLRVLELEKIDLIQAVRLVVKSTVLLLTRRGYNNDLATALSGLESKLGTDLDSLALFEQAAREIGRQIGGPAPAMVAAPEPGEGGGQDYEDLKGAVRNLVDKLKEFKNERYLTLSDAIKGLIENNSSLENILPILIDLCLTFLNDYGQEITRITHRLNSILRMLIFTEREYAKFLDNDISNYDQKERSFTSELTSGLGELKEGCRGLLLGGQTDDLINFVSERIEGLLLAVKLKEDEDAQMLDALGKEKEALTSRLDKIRRDYDSFVSQSHKTLLELETIRSVSLRDPLTKVYNRRAYDEQMGLTIENHDKGRLATFSLIIFDIDFFREVNNNYGHLAGDSILTHVGRIIKECLRCDDFVFRYGGDEFIILLPEAKLMDSIRIAEKFRHQVEAVEFKLSRNSLKTIRITISVGVTEACLGDTATSVLARADRALYLSKQSGRNKVSSF